MWIITVYTKADIAMYEYETEEEARDTLNNIDECAILSEIIYLCC